MMNDADAHAEEDKRRRDQAEIRNAAESMQFTTEKFLADNGDKLPEDKRGELQTALDELKKQLEGADYDGIKATHEKVSQIASEAGGAMYAAAQAAAGEGANGASGFTGATEGAEGGAATGASADDTVVDAEVVDEGASDTEGSR
jgi:molecular chaperone DnaK